MGMLISSMSLIHQRGSNFSSIRFTRFTKISEWRTFDLQVAELLFFCDQLLSKQHLYCFLYFVRALELLSSCIVTQEQLSLAQLFLFASASRFKKLYGLAAMKWSSHAVLHNPLCHRLWGPSSGFNSLVAERDIATFTRRITSGRNPVAEIAQQCAAEALSSSNTWKYDGEKLENLYTVDELRQLAKLFTNVRRPGAIEIGETVASQDNVEMEELKHNMEG